LRITLLISVVMFLAGTFTYLLLRQSQRNMVEGCIENLVRSEAGNFSESYNFIGNLLSPLYADRFEDMPESDIFLSLQRQEMSELQEVLNEDLATMVDSGFMGLAEVMVVLPSSSLLPSPLVLASSERDLVYRWSIPDDLVAALGDGSTFLWREAGFPELGLDQECLVSMGSTQSPFFEGLSYYYIGFKPMGDKVAGVRAFYDKQLTSANLKLGIILEGSIILIILVIFLLLDYLLRKKITEPIECLSETAERLAEGDLDVQVKVHAGSALEGLELAFKALVENIRAYISMSVGEDATEPEIQERTARFVDGRSRMLLEITAVIVAVMLVAGFSVYAILAQTQDKLLDETVQLMLDTEANDLVSFLQYSAAASMPSYVEEFKASGLQCFVEDLHAGRVSTLQEKMVGDMQLMASLGCHEVEKVFLVVPRSELNPECVVWASNDREYIYCRDLPEEFIQAMEKGQNYLLLEEGIPSMGYTGDFLVTFSRVENPMASILPFYYIAVKPMVDETAFIHDFCDRERDKANLYLGSLLGISIILAIIIAFFFLNHLITMKITRPVEELSAAAEMFLQGDLDIRVDVHEGEALECLERAFNDMVEGIRRLIP
jgi:methyl-accepting chemotaxis protein